MHAYSQKLTAGLEEDKHEYKLNWKHLVVPGRKEELCGVRQKGHNSQTREFPQSKSRMMGKVNQIIDCNT